MESYPRQQRIQPLDPAVSHENVHIAGRADQVVFTAQ